MFLIICILLLICICVGSVIYVQIYKDEQWYYLSVASGSIAFVLIILVMYENFKGEDKKKKKPEEQNEYDFDSVNLSEYDDELDLDYFSLSSSDRRSAVPRYGQRTPPQVVNINPPVRTNSNSSVRSLREYGDEYVGYD